MLVLSILVVVLGIVMPRLAWAPAASLGDEALHFKRLLVFARQEAELGGLPLRCTILKTGYRFSRAAHEGGKEVWKPVRLPPLAAYHLPTPLHIQRVDTGANMGVRLSARLRDVREPGLLAHLFFYPDGTLSPADIVMASDTSRVLLQVRPGPGGISMVIPES